MNLIAAPNPTQISKSCENPYGTSKTLDGLNYNLLGQYSLGLGAQADGTTEKYHWRGEIIGPVWSIGAESHGTSQCIPCAWCNSKGQEGINSKGNFRFLTRIYFLLVESFVESFHYICLLWLSVLGTPTRFETCYIFVIPSLCFTFRKINVRIWSAAFGKTYPCFRTCPLFIFR